MKQTKYKVKQVSPKKMHDYDGMNPQAAKKLGFKGIGKNEVDIRSNMKKSLKRTTIKHEIKEADEMKKGKSYWSAHQDAIKAEKKKMPKKEIAKKKSK
jgi:hypothetical protein